MPQLNPVNASGPRVIAPLRDGCTVVILDHDAVVLRDGLAAVRVNKRTAAEIILADYPVTARPGCNPARATAAGEINCK